MKKNKILLIGLVFIIAMLLSSCGGSSSSTATINVYNAGEYMDPSTIKEFEKETGIRVVYDTFASNEDMYIKATQSKDAYDILVPSDYMIERLIKEDIIQKLDFNNIPNYSGISSALKNKEFDPNNEYSVPYFAGTVGIIYNTEMVSEDINSWNALWDAKYKNQIIMYNSQRDSIAIALKKLGYSMNSIDKIQLEEAKEILIQQKPLVYAYLTDDGRDVLVQGDAAMGVMYSGDAALMMENNSSLKYVIPKEGSNIWIDSFVIPKNAKNKEAAEKFIDFMCRPDIAAKNAEYCVGYTSPVDAAKDLLPEKLKNSEVAYPDYSKLPELESYKDLGENVSLYDKIWTEVSATMDEKL
ncbi:ABC transporter substrate-binding protein [Peptoniphilus mikwangii]|uniref:ABC transporter substrate-binding protein n=1 Tax=Peptoniphilus mikwangii TaxID=1354300 RepID=UPI00040ED432|nr:spermidine/putrescine ABC transporter substrate-binding protein [Peptoniphilus mikwangii]